EREHDLGRRIRAAGRPREAALHLERAVALSPGNVPYRVELLNLLWDAGSDAAEDDRAVLLHRATAVSLAGVRRRPREADLHRLLGLAELRRVQWGGEDRLEFARRAFEASLSLFPTYLRTLRELAETAGLQGDTESRRKHEATIERITGRAVNEPIPADQL
ncbi:hypothetical protein ACFL2T_06940, partial [Elusimicrobiota bacterium]